jgi:hypothetical protein
MTEDEFKKLAETQVQPRLLFGRLPCRAVVVRRKEDQTIARICVQFENGVKAWRDLSELSAAIAIVP